MDEREQSPTNDDLAVDFATTIEIFARAVYRQYTCTRLDDLMQAGYEGLCQARGSFNHAMGVKFRTWAETRINGAMIDYARRESRARRVSRCLESAVQSAAEDTAAALRTGPASFALRVSALIRFGASAYKLSDPASDSPESAYEAHEAVRRFESALPLLPPREREYLQLSLVEGLTNNEIAQRWGVTKSTVSHTRITAQNRLKDIFSGEMEQPSDGGRQ